MEEQLVLHLKECDYHQKIDKAQEKEALAELSSKNSIKRPKQ